MWTKNCMTLEKTVSLDHRRTHLHSSIITDEIFTEEGNWCLSPYAESIRIAGRIVLGLTHERIKIAECGQGPGNSMTLTVSSPVYISVSFHPN